MDSRDAISQAGTAATEVTERLPDLQLPCLTAGVAVNPSRLSGRPTAINLWASWCQPCPKEMPLLQKVHEWARSGPDAGGRLSPR